MKMVQVRRQSRAEWIRPMPMRTGHFPCGVIGCTNLLSTDCDRSRKRPTWYQSRQGKNARVQAFSIMESGSRSR